MGFIKYAVERIKKMNKRAMLDKIDVIHEKTGKSKVLMFFDMIFCGFRYGAGYMDYWLFEMYNMNARQRNTVMTRGRNDSIVKKHNNPDYFHIFIRKDEFNEKFDKYLKRDWIVVSDANREAVKAFTERHDIFMAKPVDGGCGKGIEKISSADWKSKDELYDYLLKNRKIVLEEVIVQHPMLSEVYPCSINTIRIVTVLRRDGKVAVPFTYWRIGDGGRFVDNFNSQGMVAPVDAATGVVKDSAIDKKKNLYEKHPWTGTTIKGFKFPYWEEALAICREAAHVVPEMGYIGWDVAITPDGPVFVEANEFPGHDIYQLPEHTPDKIGVYPQFKNAEYL